MNLDEKGGEKMDSIQYSIVSMFLQKRNYCKQSALSKNINKIATISTILLFSPHTRERCYNKTLCNNIIKHYTVSIIRTTKGELYCLEILLKKLNRLSNLKME